MLSLRTVRQVTRRVGVARFMNTGVDNRSCEELERQYLVPTYTGNGVRGMEGLEFTHGKGSKLFDKSGKEYIDWVAGIAVNSIGHSDPDWVAAVQEQASKLAHVSNLFHSRPPVELARDLINSSKNFRKVFFCNSGTEANEAALKFARKYALTKAGIAKPTTFGCKAAVPTACATSGGVCDCWPQAAHKDTLRTEVIAFKHSFHGRTMGALSMTHKPQIRQPFAPFPGEVKFARFNHLSDVEKYLSNRTAAIIVEPVQGEGGIFPATASFMQGLRSLATSVDALLIVDEVQCGLGRTGRLWAHEAYGITPDIMTLAKPLAGGLPIGAVMTTDEVSSCILPGDHGTTYGGNPFVTHVAQTVFRKISDPDFLATSRERGRYMLSGLRKLRAKYPNIIADVRGTLDEGLFVGVEVKVPPKEITQPALENGLIIITAGDNVLRICPPLNIAEADINAGLAILEKVLLQVNVPK